MNIMKQMFMHKPLGERYFRASVFMIARRPGAQNEFVLYGKYIKALKTRRLVMKISAVRIQNFRGFLDQTIYLGKFSCFVGPNGSGKSTVLTAMNIFFRQYKDSSSDLSKLTIDDFHHRNTELPIIITLTFIELSESAERDLSDYVRQGKLIVSVKATYDERTGFADVKQYGTRLGKEAFRVFFEKEKNGAKVQELKELFLSLRQANQDLSSASTKPEMISALHQYEKTHPEECTPIESEDQFYGISKGTNRLGAHIQWVFIPASKDYSEEAEETKNSALGQILARTIRSRVDFSERLLALRETAKEQYGQLLDSEQQVLDELSINIESRLKEWSHPNASAKVTWKHDSETSIKIEDPWASIKLGEKGFESDICRFGHGLQRSYLLSLLQELVTSDSESNPTLVMGIEEPELYQHPPQERYLAEVLHSLSESGSQILICTLSPLFIPGDDFETVRMIRNNGNPPKAESNQITYADLARELSFETRPLKETGVMAKLFTSLNPHVNEMFFCKNLILVEGVEDIAYIMSYLHLDGKIDDYRKKGCHIVPVNGKRNLKRPLAIAKLLKIPTFVVFDADTNESKQDRIVMHKKDNMEILTIAGVYENNEWPAEDIKAPNLTLWKTSITTTVKNEIGPIWNTISNSVERELGQPGDLEKNPLSIARIIEGTWNNGNRSSSLLELNERILSYFEI